MKKVITILLLLPTMLIGQTKYKTLSKFNTHDPHTELEGSFEYRVKDDDTTKFVCISFKNGEYSSLVDTRHIWFYSEKNLKEFVADLKESLTHLKQPETISWDKEYYSISVLENAKNIYLQESHKSGKGYVFLSKKQVNTIIEWGEALPWANK